MSFFQCVRVDLSKSNEIEILCGDNLNINWVKCNMEHFFALSTVFSSTIFYNFEVFRMLNGSALTKY